MKFLSFDNLKYVAIGILAILVLLRAYRYFTRAGFQNASPSIGNAQKAIIQKQQTDPSVLCKTLKGTQDIIQTQINKMTDAAAIAGLKLQLDALTPQVTAACNAVAPPPPAEAPPPAETPTS